MNHDESIFLAKLQQALVLLDEVDDIITNNPEMQQNVDWEISDYLHFIQNNNLSEKAKLEINDRLKTCRIKRNDYNSIFTLGKIFSENRGKLAFKETRKQLNQLISNTLNTLHKDYNYRVLDQETLNSFLNMENNEIIKKHRGKNACISKEDLEDKLNKGMTLTSIAKELNVSASNLSMLKKKYGISSKRKEVSE